VLDSDTPCDYVIGPGVSHTRGEFVEEAFSYAGLDWKDHVRIDPGYFRAPESPSLRAMPRGLRRTWDGSLVSRSAIWSG
jgi:GDPmannose 4,6-dehydratase